MQRALLVLCDPTYSLIEPTSFKYSPLLNHIYPELHLHFRMEIRRSCLPSAVTKLLSCITTLILDMYYMWIIRALYSDILHLFYSFSDIIMCINC